MPKSNVIQFGRSAGFVDHQNESVTPIEIIDTSPTTMDTLRAVIIRDAQEKIKKEADDMVRAGNLALVANFLRNLARYYEERIQP